MAAAAAAAAEEVEGETAALEDMAGSTRKLRSSLLCRRINRRNGAATASTVMIAPILPRARGLEGRIRIEIGNEGLRVDRGTMCPMGILAD
jgi:hypothetical protein